MLLTLILAAVKWAWAPSMPWAVVLGPMAVLGMAAELKSGLELASRRRATARVLAPPIRAGRTARPADDLADDDDR